eukprot:TCONS_00012725-protein
MLAMEQMLRKYLSQKVFLYTTDPIIDQALQCGSISSLYRTVDFGAGHDVNKSFALQRKYQPKGPYVNSEYYTGWFDNWGEGHHAERPEYIAHYLDQILSFENASVNLYLFEGGSNRNFMNGGSSCVHVSFIQFLTTFLVKKLNFDGNIQFSIFELK